MTKEDLAFLETAQMPTRIDRFASRLASGGNREANTASVMCAPQQVRNAPRGNGKFPPAGSQVLTLDLDSCRPLLTFHVLVLRQNKLTLKKNKKQKLRKDYKFKETKELKFSPELRLKFEIG